VLQSFRIAYWRLQCLVKRLAASLQSIKHNRVLIQVMSPIDRSVGCLSVCLRCVTFADSEPYCHSILFVCVWMSVGHSATYSLPRLIDHNHIWLAGIYLSSDQCKPFWIPYLPYFRCQREKYAKFRLFPNMSTVGHAKPYSSYNS